MQHGQDTLLLRYTLDTVTLKIIVLEGNFVQK